MADKIHQHLFTFLMHTESENCKFVADAINEDLIDEHNSKTLNIELKRLEILLRVLSSYKDDTQAGKMEKLDRIMKFVQPISFKQAKSYFAVLSSTLDNTSFLNFDFENLENQVKAGNMSEGMYLRICDMFKEVHKVRQLIELVGSI